MVGHECSNVYECNSLFMRLAGWVQRGFAGECARLTGNTWFMAVCVIIVAFITVKTWFAEALPIAFVSAWSNFHLIFILCFHPKYTKTYKAVNENNSTQTYKHLIVFLKIKLV